MRKLFWLVVTLSMLAVPAGASGAASGTITLHPGQSKKAGRYTVVCSARPLSRKARRIVLRIGYRVKIESTTYRCVRGARPAPQPIPKPTPAPTPIPIGSRQNPVPLGQPAVVSNGWTVTVTGVVPDATGAILAANMFNDAPAIGDQFFMIAARATYSGPGSSHLDSSFAMRAVGASGVVKTTFENGCGVLPDPSLEVDDPEVFSGGTVEGNAACWEIPSSDAASLVMFYDPSDDSDGSKRVWFALR